MRCVRSQALSSSGPRELPRRPPQPERPIEHADGGQHHVPYSNSSQIALQVCFSSRVVTSKEDQSTPRPVRRRLFHLSASA